MKSNEFHRLILKSGWTVVRKSGSHVIYEKAGVRYPVPDHGAKEMNQGLVLKIRKEMGL